MFGVSVRGGEKLPSGVAAGVSGGALGLGTCVQHVVGGGALWAGGLAGPGEDGVGAALCAWVGASLGVGLGDGVALVHAMTNAASSDTSARRLFL